MKRMIITISLTCLIIGIFWKIGSVENSSKPRHLPVNSASVDKTVVASDLVKSDNVQNIFDSELLLEPPEVQLIGVIYKGSARFALLKSSASIQQYQVGDFFDPHWEIAEIYSNRVALRHLHQLVTYRLRNAQSEDFVEADFDTNPVRLAALKRMESEQFRQKISRYLNGRIPEEVRYPMGVASSGMEKYDETHYGIDRTAISDLINDGQLFRHINVSFNEGKTAITEIVPGSLFDKGGLQVGDMLESVNGNPVNKPTEMALLYTLFHSHDLIEVELVRKGEKRAMQYAIRDRSVE